jgi:hypothetical protein
MANIETFESLAAAAHASFPMQFCFIVAIREMGDDGYVLFDTRANGQPYLYGVNYERGDDGRWMEGNSSNGSGWSQIGPDAKLGTLAVWEEGPPDVDRVRVELVDGQVREEPVENRAYLAVWWRVPRTVEVKQIRYHIDGTWT